MITNTKKPPSPNWVANQKNVSAHELLWLLIHSIWLNLDAVVTQTKVTIQIKKKVDKKIQFVFSRFIVILSLIIYKVVSRGKPIHRNTAKNMP